MLESRPVSCGLFRKSLPFICKDSKIMKIAICGRARSMVEGHVNFESQLTCSSERRIRLQLNILEKPFLRHCAIFFIRLKGLSLFKMCLISAAVRNVKKNFKGGFVWTTKRDYKGQLINYHSCDFSPTFFRNKCIWRLNFGERTEFLFRECKFCTMKRTKIVFAEFWWISNILEYSQDDSASTARFLPHHKTIQSALEFDAFPFFWL